MAPTSHKEAAALCRDLLAVLGRHDVRDDAILRLEQDIRDLQQAAERDAQRESRRAVLPPPPGVPRPRGPRR